MVKDLTITKKNAEDLYNVALDLLKAGDLVSARKELLRVAELYCEISEDSVGPISETYESKAEEIVEFIKSDLNVKIEQSIKQTARAKLQEARKAKKDNQEEEDQTIFEASEIPSISFADVAGLQAVKDAVNEKILLPRQHPDIYEKFKKKAGGGILMYGPPGTGKTMVAKAIAHEINAKFFSVRCSDIVGKYFGEAEKNIKSLFETARLEDEAVIFFDEVEALCAKRDSHSTVMKRIIPELLAQMQGFEDSDNSLLLLAATNRPWDLDSAFMRPGRFDEKIFIDLPDSEAREYIINKELKEIPISQLVEISTIVDGTEGFNGADIVEFCSKLKSNAIKRTITSSQDGGISEITVADVYDTLDKCSSSVSQNDMKKLADWTNKK